MLILSRVSSHLARERQNCIAMLGQSQEACTFPKAIRIALRLRDSGSQGLKMSGSFEKLKFHDQVGCYESPATYDCWAWAGNLAQTNRVEWGEDIVDASKA